MASFGRKRDKAEDQPEGKQKGLLRLSSKSHKNKQGNNPLNQAVPVTRSGPSSNPADGRMEAGASSNHLTSIVRSGGRSVPVRDSPTLVLPQSTIVDGFGNTTNPTTLGPIIASTMPTQQSLLSDALTQAPDSLSRNVPTQAAQPAKPIRQLWNEAYEDLTNKECNLMKKYEAVLSSEIDIVLVPSTTAVGRRDQMSAMLRKKMTQVKQDMWKLRFGKNEVPLQDLAKPIVGIIKWAEENVDSFVNANPYASIAWTGISMLLPLFTNPSEQAASLSTGLEYISNLIARSSMREELYARRYESAAMSQDRNDILTSHNKYRETLKDLYVRVLKFQASSICYYSKNGFYRLSTDIIKWHDWDALLEDVKYQENAFSGVYEIWKDTIYQADYETLSKRHSESLHVTHLISQNIGGFLQAREAAQKDGDRQLLISWLSPIDPSTTYNIAREKHQPDTCDWLLNDNQKFGAWQTSPDSFLWLNGKAGSGKSILSSSIISHLKHCYDADPQVALAYFFFRFDDPNKSDVAMMIRSLIKQLYCYRPNTPEEVERLHQYRTREQQPELSVLMAALKATLRGFSSVFVVIDALDEYPGKRQMLLKAIYDVQISNINNLHMLCTSRREADIEIAFEPLFLKTSKFDLNLLDCRRAVDHDIRLHVETALEMDTYRTWPEDIKKEARDVLVKKADGMFQYVAAHLVMLSEHSTRSDIRRALDELPEGLDATYDRMLLNVPTKYQDQVIRMLKWLAFSFKPLTLEELAEVFILDFTHNSDKQSCLPPFSRDVRLNRPEDVCKYLPGLVSRVRISGSRAQHRGSLRYDEPATEIRLSHFSIKEYLISQRRVQSPAAKFSTTRVESHLHISEACLAYHLAISQVLLATRKEVLSHVLWEYVVCNWHRHLEEVPRQSWVPSVLGRALQLLTRQSRGLINIIRISDPDEWDRSGAYNKGFDQLVTPLYYVASRGAKQLTTLLLERGSDIDEQSPGQFGYPLQASVYHRQGGVIHFLIEQGANVNAQGGRFGIHYKRRHFHG